ncbi:MAG TPA: sigma-70 family RNA polymerase sigma factor [Tahibacter sp.]|uniref:RNA polymerase sigma factor n=1 Tax=Tahibacter sp. TaxID=2056211 RepID=UPI002B7B3179|nr:sigma-70 family RNA polymerase sigma factor [Tahibacter sp.]HSX62698.1 sigma-70 family RNA polymerase sigma factor [Tahibacter sp.]
MEQPASSRELADRIRAGDARAERELYLRYARGLRFLVRQRDNDDQLAQDVVQDCFRIALPQLRSGRLENPDAIAGFLRSITLNLLSEYQRAGRRRPEDDFDEDAGDLPVDDSAGPLEVTTRSERRTLIRALIAELPVERDRQLLWRYYVLDQDKPALCTALGLTPAHFDRVLHRAKNRFRELATARGLARPMDES